MGARDFIISHGGPAPPGIPVFSVSSSSLENSPRPSLGKYFTQTPAAPGGRGARLAVGRRHIREPACPSLSTRSQVGSSYLVLSNDDKELQKVAAELASSDDPSKTLSTVRDWSFVSQHEYWGYRFIRRKGLDGKDLAGLDQGPAGRRSASRSAIDVKQQSRRDEAVRFPGYKTRSAAAEQTNCG